MRVKSPRPLTLIPPLWASQRVLSQASLHYDPIVHYSILYNRSLPYWSGILWLILFRPLLAKRWVIAFELTTLGMRSFGISSEVYRTDLVWKKLITQGPKGVLSIWLIGNFSRYDSKNKMHFSPKVHLEVFLCLNIMVTWYVTRPKKLNMREIG